MAFPTNKPFLPSKFYTLSTNAASFFSSSHIHTKRVPRCSPMHAYVYVFVHRKERTKECTWPSGRERFRGLFQNILPRLIRVSNEKWGATGRSSASKVVPEEKATDWDDSTSRVHGGIIYEIRFLSVFLVVAVVTHAISSEKNMYERTRKKIAQKTRRHP